MGSLIQPSIGMALSVARIRVGPPKRCSWVLTRMEHIAERAVVKDHDLTQIRLYLSKILDVGPVA